MNSSQHRKIAELLDNIVNLVHDLTGFASNKPFCFNSKLKDDEVKLAIKLQLQNILDEELDQVEAEENPILSKKMENILKACIEALEEID